MDTAVRAAFSPTAAEKLVTGPEGEEAQPDNEPPPSTIIKKIKIISLHSFLCLSMAPIVINIREDVNALG